MNMNMKSHPATVVRVQDQARAWWTAWAVGTAMLLAAALVAA